MTPREGLDRQRESAPTSEEIDAALERLEGADWSTLAYREEQMDLYIEIYSTEALGQALMRSVTNEIDPDEIDDYRQMVDIFEEKVYALGEGADYDLNEDGYYPEETIVHAGEDPNDIQLDLNSMQHQIDYMRDVLDDLELENHHDHASDLEREGVSQDAAADLAGAETTSEAIQAAERAVREVEDEPTTIENFTRILREILESISSGVASLIAAISSVFNGDSTVATRPNPDGSLEAPIQNEPSPEVENNTNIDLDAVEAMARSRSFARVSFETPSGNGNRPTLVIVPRNYDPNAISVIMHGTGGNRNIGSDSAADNGLNRILDAAETGNAITIVPFAYDGAEDGVEPGEIAGRGSGSAQRNGYDDKWFSAEVAEDFGGFIDEVLSSESLRGLHLDVQDLIISGFSAGGAALRNIAEDSGSSLASKYNIVFRVLDAAYGNWVDPVHDLVVASRQDSNLNDASMEIYVRARTQTVDNSDHLENSVGVDYTRYDYDLGHYGSIEFARVT
jgi:hypothetical protein